MIFNKLQVKKLEKLYRIYKVCLPTVLKLPRIVKNGSLRGRRKKGRGRGEGEREKGREPSPLPNPPPLFPFLPIPYPLPLSTPATQAIKMDERLKKTLSGPEIPPEVLGNVRHLGPVG